MPKEFCRITIRQPVNEHFIYASPTNVRMFCDQINREIVIRQSTSDMETLWFLSHIETHEINALVRVLVKGHIIQSYDDICAATIYFYDHPLKIKDFRERLKEDEKFRFLDYPEMLIP